MISWSICNAGTMNNLALKIDSGNVLNATEAAKEHAELDYHFGKRQKDADSSYNYHIAGKLKSGSRTEWRTQFDRSLEYLMFPSLQLLPQEVQDAEILQSKAKKTYTYGSPKGSHVKNSSPLHRAKTTGSPGRRHGKQSPLGGPSSPQAGRDRDDESISSSQQQEPEPEAPDYTKPKVTWSVEISKPDPKRADDAQSIHDREFNRRLNEIGEVFHRQQLKDTFQAGIKAAEDELLAEKRATLTNMKKQKSTAQQMKDATVDGSPKSSKGHPWARRKQGVSDTTNYAGTTGSVRGEDSMMVRMGLRRASTVVPRSVMSNLNAPENIYKTLRLRTAKKSDAGNVLAQFHAGGHDNDSLGGMYNDETMYYRQKEKLKSIFGEKAYQENAHDMEGLLYYRFQYDEELEAERIAKEKEEDQRMAYKQPGKLPRTASGNSLSQNSGKDLHMGSLDESENGHLMHEFQKETLKSFRNSTIITSDVSNINLSRLRRAVQQSLNGLSHAAVVNADELLGDPEAHQSLMDQARAKERAGIRPRTSPTKASSAHASRSSPQKRDHADAAMKTIENKEKSRFLQSVGLSEEVVQATPMALTSPDKTPLGAVMPKAKAAKIEVLNPDGEPYGIEAGEPLGGISTYSPEVHRSSRLSNQGITGGTRIAQDALTLAQLNAGIVPQAFIRRSSNLESVDIDICHFGIGDAQGECLGVAIKGLKNLRGLNLENNRLTSVSIPLIIGNVYFRTLVSLNLSNNMVHNQGSRAIGTMLCDPECALTELSLSKSGLHCSDLPALMQGLKREGSTVTNVNLSSNEIAAQGSASLTELIAHPRCTLKRLDMSWNKIGTEGAVSIAGALAKNVSLQVLLLAANGIADRGGQILAQALRDNNDLVELGLAQNNISGGSCFVFSKTIARHPKITKLDLSFNPVGEAGARSIYRQIMRGLRCFVIMRSCSYFVQEDMFNYTTPSLNSPYELDLSEPYRAAVMAELIIMAREDPTSCRFGSVKYAHAGQSGHASSHVAEELVLHEKGGEIMCKGKIYQPPTSGRLVVQFFSAVSRPSIENAASAKSIEVTILIVTHAREQDRLDYLKLITSDLYLTCAQAQHIINAFVKRKIIGSGGIGKIDILACTWTRLLDTENMYDFMCANIPASERRSLINKVSIDEYKFNWTNPTGHWRLNLENRKQLLVMMKLISINGQEAEFSRLRSGRDDTSQEGNWFNFRNSKLITSKGTTNLVIDQTYVDNLPRTGIIDFDYVSTTRPGQALLDAKDDKTVGPEADEAELEAEVDGAHATTTPGARSTIHGGSSNIYDKIQVISDEEFYNLMGRLGLSNRKRIPNDQSLFPLIELQLAVCKYWFSVQQVMAVMDTFDLENFHTQANVAVAMFGRIKDLHNFDQLLHNCSELKTQREILNRLGCLNVINPLKLALTYLIPLQNLDYRILLTTLLEISPQEGTEAIREDPKTDVSVLTFYGALHRIVAVSRPENLRFTYLDFGVQFGGVVAWGLRRDAIREFLVGTKPIDKGMFRIISMYREMEKAGTLTRGPIDLQYANHLKVTKNSRKTAVANRTGGATAAALRSKVADASVAVKKLFEDEKAQVESEAAEKEAMEED